LQYKVLVMSEISQFLFPAPAERSAAAIFIWWESRRLAYNAIMGVTGVFALGMMTVAAHLPPGSTELPPIPLVLLYAILANVCYCWGPLAECARDDLAAQVAANRARAFSHGPHVLPRTQSSSDPDHGLGLGGAGPELAALTTIITRRFNEVAAWCGFRTHHRVCFGRA
jgi:hypothetical protein